MTATQYRQYWQDRTMANRAAFAAAVSRHRCNPRNVLYCAACGIGSKHAADKQRASFPSS